MTEAVDLLVFAAHPDDAELHVGGTLLKLAAQGRRCAVVDLTAGEMGTRGSAAERKRECEAASSILQLSARDNLGFPDGSLSLDQKLRLEIVRRIRRYRPKVVATHHPDERHPDHFYTARLVAEAMYHGGLGKIETEHKRYRPAALVYFAPVVGYAILPSFVVDVTPHIEGKWEALRVYRSQFHDPHSSQPATDLSHQDFLFHVESCNRYWGSLARVRYAEGYVASPQYALRLDSPLVLV
ncbi:MAG: bacillithiol biosynthesis deacetylase BshB1 [Acidobacteriota bacterium]